MKCEPKHTKIYRKRDCKSFTSTIEYEHILGEKLVSCRTFWFWLTIIDEHSTILAKQKIVQIVRNANTKISPNKYLEQNSIYLLGENFKSVFFLFNGFLGSQFGVVNA